MIFTRFGVFFILFAGLFFLFSCGQGAADLQRIARASVQRSLIEAGEELKNLADRERDNLRAKVDVYLERMPFYEATESVYPALYECMERIEKAKIGLAKAENAFAFCGDLQKAYFAMQNLQRQIGQMVRYAAARLNCGDVEPFLASIALIGGGEEEVFLMLCRWKHDACYAVFKSVRWLNAVIENTKLLQPKDWRIQARHTPVFARKNADANATLQRGDSLHIEASLYGYAPNFPMTLSVDGQAIAAQDGKFYYQAPTNKLGEQRYTATARITNPFTGEVYVVQRQFLYAVMPNPLPK